MEHTHVHLQLICLMTIACQATVVYSVSALPFKAFQERSRLCLIIPLFAHFSDVQWRTRAVHCFDLLIWEAVAIIAALLTFTFAPSKRTGHRYTSVSCQKGDSLPTREYLHKTEYERLTLTSTNELSPFFLSFLSHLGFSLRLFPATALKQYNFEVTPFDRIGGKYLPSTARQWGTRSYACYFLPLISCWHLYTKQQNRSFIGQSVFFYDLLFVKHTFATVITQLSVTGFNYKLLVLRCRALSSSQCNPLIYQELSWAAVHSKSLMSMLRMQLLLIVALLSGSLWPWGCCCLWKGYIFVMHWTLLDTTWLPATCCRTE